MDKINKSSGKLDDALYHKMKEIKRLDLLEKDLNKVIVFLLFIMIAKFFDLNPKDTEKCYI